MIKQRIYNFALFNTPKIHSIHNTYSARAFFSPQGSWLASTRSKILIQRATRRFIHVLFSSMLLCKRVHLRSDSHGPLTLQARLLAHFKLSSPPAAVRVPQNGAFFLEIENGIVWNGIETG